MQHRLAHVIVGTARFTGCSDSGIRESDFVADYTPNMFDRLQLVE